jgi:hypothetical protein
VKNLPSPRNQVAAKIVLRDPEGVMWQRCTWKKSGSPDRKAEAKSVSQ